MIAWARTKLHHRFLGIVEAAGTAALGERRTDLFVKEVMRLAMTGLSHDWLPFSEQLLPDPLGRSLPLPAMVGYPSPPHRSLYAALAHLRRTAQAVGGGQIPAPAGSAADPFEEFRRLDRGKSESCLR